MCCVESEISVSLVGNQILQTRSQTRKRAIENQGLTNNTKDPEKRQTSDLSYIRVVRSLFIKTF